MPQPLTLADLSNAVAGSAAAFRCITEYQPAGGEGDKIFPATYKGGEYSEEDRRMPGKAELVKCVLIDSVQSQANRMELALLQAWEENLIKLPLITVDFKGQDLLQVLRITSLEAPHRIADAIFRDSVLDGIVFRESDLGKRLDSVNAQNSTALFEVCPTALVFGMWHSTGRKGGQGAKFARALVSEIVGMHAVRGEKTSSRIDPAQIVKNAGPLYQSESSKAELEWTLDPKEAKTEKDTPVLYNRGKGTTQSKPGDPSKANHGNYPPNKSPGGYTISKAVQTTVLSLASLRRLNFPLQDQHKPSVDRAARTALAALGLCAASLARERGCDLRSRCQLHPTKASAWELLDQPGEPTLKFLLPGTEAVVLLNQAIEGAKVAGLPWMEKELVLKPHPQLVNLVRRSQELSAKSEPEEVQGV